MTAPFPRALAGAALRALCTLALAAAAPFAVAAPDAKPAGPLQVAPNRHHLQLPDGTPFLWLGDTAWGMLQYLKREEVDAYLDQRKALGFTVIQTVAHWYPHGGGLKSGPANIPNAYGFRPFAGTDDAPDLSHPLVVPGGSPDAPNDYWDHADYVVRAVRQRGMVLGLLPAWARAYLAGTSEGSRPLYDTQTAASFGAFLGQRYRDEPHIVWILGGDTRPFSQGFDKNQRPSRLDARPLVRAMAEGLGRGVTGKALAWNRPDPAWDKLLMTYHPDGDAPYSSSHTLHDDAWLDANGVEVWRQVEQVHATMLADYQREAPAKPSLFLEGSYEYGSYRHECGWVTPVMVRRQLYHSFFGGGAGHTYGAGPVWAMRGQGGDYNCGYTWQQALHFPGAVQASGVAKAILQANAWWRWVPHGALIDGVGEGDGFKAAVLDETGGRGLVYFSNRSATTVRNILGGAASATWIDPQNGREAKAGSFAKDEARALLPPSGWEDALLVLQRQP